MKKLKYWWYWLFHKEIVVGSIWYEFHQAYRNPKNIRDPDDPFLEDEIKTWYTEATILEIKKGWVKYRVGKIERHLPICTFAKSFAPLRGDAIILRMRYFY